MSRNILVDNTAANMSIINQLFRILSVLIIGYTYIIASTSDECSPNCEDDPSGITEATCDEATRRCLFGCRENYTGDQCDRCIRGKTGDQCQYICDYNCQNCSWDNDKGVCDMCLPSYYYFNKNCEQCRHTCLQINSTDFYTCDQSDGICLYGCKDDWHGDRCDKGCGPFCINRTCSRHDGCCTEGCKYDTYGGCECQTRCHSNCEGGTCYQNETCSQGCKLNTWGPDCSQTCNENCTDADDNSMSVCNRAGECIFGCKRGWTGNQCQKQCNINCEGGTCYQNETCSQGCKLNTWGPDCSQTCSENCTDADDNSTAVCTRAGECIFGCKRGWAGNQCGYQCDYNCRICTWDNAIGAVTVGCDHCRSGYFYQHNICEQCRITCLENLTSDLPICDPTDGMCSFGCADQWFGDQCDKQCSSLCGGSQICDRHSGCCTEGCRNDTYGGCKCQTLCNINCEGGTCFQNETCSQGCTMNTWGPYCNQTCSENCLDADNNSISVCTRAGECIFGCKDTFTGPQCMQSCSVGCLNNNCDQATGDCSDGCMTGRYGSFCNDTSPISGDISHKLQTYSPLMSIVYILVWIEI